MATATTLSPGLRGDTVRWAPGSHPTIRLKDGSSFAVEGSDTFDYYVDSVAGSDTALGTYEQPFATLAKAATLLADGITIGLKRGGHWREQLDFSAFDDVMVGAYGSGLDPMPLVDASDIAVKANFALSGGRTAAYDISWAHDVEVSTLGFIRVWEDGASLTWVSSAALCESTPGSYYVPGSATDPVTIYVHPTGSTNPVSDSKGYEITARDYCVRGGDLTLNGSIIEDIHGRRNGHNNGGILGAAVRRCLGTDGTKHSIWVVAGGVGEDNVAYRFGNGTGRWGNATAFVTYAPVSVAATTYYRRNWVYGTHEDSPVSAFYAHTAGGGALLAEMNYKDSYAYRVNDVISAADTTVLTVDGGFSERTGSPFAGYSGHLNITNYTAIGTSIDGANAATFNRFFSASPATATVRRVRVYMQGNTSGSLFFRGNDVDVQDSTFYGTAGGTRVVIDDNDASSPKLKNCVMYEFLQPLQLAAGGFPAECDYNVYYREAGDSGWQVDAVNYASFALWRAAYPSYDANAIHATNPLFTGDPQLGDFRLNAASVAYTGGRSAGATGYIPRPQWAALAEAWAAGFLGITPGS